MQECTPEPELCSPLPSAASSTAEQTAQPLEDEQTLVAEAAKASEIIEDVLDDVVSKNPQELGEMSKEGLKKARKAKDYRSEVLFASLADFYRWMPHHGRVKAASRVARLHGRGPAFARVLCAQARHFEATAALKPSRQGQRVRGTSLLDDETVQMGLQAWLRTLEPGKVSDGPCCSSI